MGGCLIAVLKLTNSRPTPPLIHPFVHFKILHSCEVTPKTGACSMPQSHSTHSTTFVVMAKLVGIHFYPAPLLVININMQEALVKGTHYCTVFFVMKEGCVGYGGRWF